MTSASELFHNRRSRIARNDPELGFGSSSSSFDRSLPLPILHHHHHNHTRRRSRHHHRRGEGEDCEPIRRPSRSRHRTWQPWVRSHKIDVFQQEHESIRLDHGASQFSIGNSSSSNGASISRTDRMQFGRSDQLPGDVLLARERLVERLRGISLSSNRQSSRLTPGIASDEFTYGDDFRLVDAGDWEVESSADLLAMYTSSSESSALTDTLLSLPDSSTNRPPGLTQEEVDCLQREYFSVEDEDGPSMLKMALECSICLNMFHEGDELICLPCIHKFHTGCLCPWVRTCGDCPNCRAGVIV